MKTALLLATTLAGLALAGCSSTARPSASASGKSSATTPDVGSGRADIASASAAPVIAADVSEVPSDSISQSEAARNSPQSEAPGVNEKKDSTVTSAGIRVTGGFKRFASTEAYFDPDDPYFVPEDGGTKSDAEIYFFDPFRDRPVDTAPAPNGRKQVDASDVSAGPAK